MRKVALAILLAAWSGPQHGWGQSHSPTGPEFQVNTVTTGDQLHGRVARTSTGGFVVAWDGQDGSGYGVFARRFDSSGAPEGAAEFRVNSYTTGAQSHPALAPDASEGFVVVWESDLQDGSAAGVFAQRYDGGLAPLGGEFRVNVYTTSYQNAVSVASDASGAFLVAWSGAEETGADVIGQRYDASGIAQGSEFRLNSYTSGFQRFPSVAANAAGDFVAIWTSGGQDGNGSGVFGQRYDSQGAPAGGEFAVNTYTTGAQVAQRVAVAPDGRFVVTWISPGDDGSGLNVWARRYDASGATLGLPFRVNQYTTNDQTEPDVAIDADGNVMVVWTSLFQDGNGLGVFARVFDPSGAPMGDDLRVNSYTTGSQRWPSVTGAPEGNFVVVWTSFAQDGSQWGVFGQRIAPDFLFRDGVDSGNLSAWSSSATDGGDLAVSALAAMKLTTFGIRAQVDDTAGLYVQDDTPNDANRYRARFYFDPNGFDPGEALGHRRTRIFIAFEDGPRRLAAVVLRRIGGVYSLMVRARQDDNSQADTPFIPITDAPHVVEFDWRRATGPNTLDGRLELWIDGTSVATLTGLDNSISAVDFVRMGALSVKAGASGTLYWDEFESRRVSYIGP
jgi:hypothetical protein